MNIHENFSLKHFNTFGIDVKARHLVEFGTVDEIQHVLNDKKFISSEKLILGGGSNILFTRNFDGLVLKNNLKGIDLISENEEHYFVKAAAGEVWNDLVIHCINNNYAGIENLSLIPGCVGASPMQNIGAYGVELKDCFYELEALHVFEKKIHKFTNVECEFGYRESVFKRRLKNQFIITSVTFKLNKKPVFNIAYGAIEQELETMGISQLSIASISKAVCNIRSSKLPNPTETGNAGSFFKNPQISLERFNSLKEKFSELVSYDLTNGNKKLAAGWLIEQCGWKGKTIGNCGVHKKQALVLVNNGNAGGEEIYSLSEKIICSVKSKFGVELEREVNII